jgi:cell division topological specificity factor
MTVPSFLNRFLGEKPVPSAKLAKNRLAAVIQYERNTREEYDFMPALQRDLIEVLSRYFPVNLDDISINRETQGTSEMLEINIALPDSVGGL